MKTTVYAIGISTTTAVKKELKKERETYAKLKKTGGNKTQRLKSAFKILELTLAWCEELDESEVVQDVDLDESSKSLKRALERANNYAPMLSRPAFRDSTLPTECFETLIAGYQRLEMYAEALVTCESLVEWERKRNDKVNLQSALRQIANLYFQRGYVYPLFLMRLFAHNIITITTATIKANLRKPKRMTLPMP
ncbi:hypothetical protein BCR43DRAFT_488697 [Syncephalastrum racemosum]|uniref:Uncharacterized protein n=1 Tax=Syncephalastrum racemosum TaxID=13706 RepID=A0A1X2HJ30_SYNRA|nr:hypothetical protein BCR43DRAFT_488697 [Syncephalastrum racemosum]